MLKEEEFLSESEGKFRMMKVYNTQANNLSHFDFDIFNGKYIDRGELALQIYLKHDNFTYKNGKPGSK